jgi:hypothetical protein
VVRVITPQRDGMAFGSGTLVAVNETQGLVLTNWHVVEEAAGSISVLFPDGFSSVARVLKADRDWDLAALLIHRPHVEPVSLARQAPRPGELLTIAGYGSGTYRAATGRCLQYVAPARDFPFGMVELGAAARQGDSGGPILNSRGELAGVLFGTGGGATAGSYCGRVRWFLASIVGEPAGNQREPSMIAEDLRGNRSIPLPPETSPPVPAAPAVAALAKQPEGSLPRPPATPPRPPMSQPAQLADAPRPVRETAPKPAPIAPRPPASPPLVSLSSGESLSVPSAGAPIRARDSDSSRNTTLPEAPATEAPLTYLPGPPATVVVDPFGAGGRFEQIKTFLAGVGLLAILFHALRLLSLTQSSATARRKSRSRGS